MKGPLRHSLMSLRDSFRYSLRLNTYHRKRFLYIDPKCRHATENTPEEPRKSTRRTHAYQKRAELSSAFLLRNTALMSDKLVTRNLLKQLGNSFD